MNKKARKYTCTYETGDEPCKTAYDLCCQQKQSGCAQDGTCPEFCEMEIQGRIRLTNPDTGLYWKWDVDENGLPQGCDCFNPKWTDKVRNDEKCTDSTKINRPGHNIRMY